MSTLNATIKVLLEALLEDAVDIGTVRHSIPYSPSNVLSSGTGANQANQIWADQRTLTASSSESLDLAGGLTNAFGATVTFTKVKAILVMAAAANVNDVQLGGAASNQFINWVANSSDIVNVKPGGIFLLTAPDATGLAVTAGTGDILKVANSAGGSSVVYDIVIIGVA